MTAAEDGVFVSALEIARDIVTRGWRPFPVDSPSLKVCAGTGARCRRDREALGDCPREKRGKHPVGGWGTMTSSEPQDGMLKVWFGREARNVGIGCGPSGLLVLDEDELGVLEKLAHELDEVVPITYRVRTGRGWHYYFEDPDNEFGNSAGALADHHIDVRGGNGSGGYVLAAGSTHWSGHVYEAEDPFVAPAAIPEWIKKVIRTPSAKAQGKSPERTGGEKWNDDVRHGFAEDLIGQYDRHREAVHALVVADGEKVNGGEFRHALYLAALDGWRLLDCGLIDEFTMLNQVRDAIMAVWGAEPDDDDRTIVYEEARDKAGISRWEVTLPFDQADDSSDDEESAFDKEVTRKLRELQVIEEARRRLAQARRAHRPKIADGLITNLDLIEPPLMLMSLLIPEESVGFLAGRSGAYKSFLATSWACCIATGRPWLGRSEFMVRRPLKVLYVAAEGAAGAAGRIKAWEKANEVSRENKLWLYPRSIHLNDEGQADELAEVITSQGVEFLIVDTYHRSAPGTEENSSTDFGMVFEAVAAFRDDLGCSTLFLDHTGGAKAGNPRGTSAKRDDADYVLSSTYQGEEAVVGAQRELFVTKLKDEDTSGRWNIRLEGVKDEHFPIVTIGALDGHDIHVRGDWFLMDNCPELTVDVIGVIDVAANKGNRKGRGRDAARWILRLLMSVNDENGLSVADIKRMLKAAPPTEKVSEDLIRRGISLLGESGICWRDGAKIGVNS